MIDSVDVSLGILLGVSISVLILAVASYRRSGVLSLLLVSIGVAIHSAFTAAILIVGHTTEVLAGVDGPQMVLLDVLVFASAILVGALGGRPRA